MAAFATVIWLLCGLVNEGWWVQFGCFALAAYMMVEINNIHALIRIYSRMVTCTFLLTACCACFLFPSVRGAIMQLCFIVALTILFMTYQDKTSSGYTYYAFLFIGFASIAYIQIVWVLPLMWLFMATHLQSLSWRTWGASIFGLLTPYWFSSLWLVWTEDLTPLTDHVAQLGDIAFMEGYESLTVSHILLFAFVMLLSVTGIVHYIRKHHDDKIRIRLIYGFFIWTDMAAAVLLVLLPQYYDWLMPIMIVTTAPLIAHFVTLTSTKATNVYCCVLAGITLLLIVYNLWVTSYLF